MIRAVAIASLLGVAGIIASFWLLGEDLSTALSIPAWAYLIGLGLAAANYLSGAIRLVLLARHLGESLTLFGALRAYAMGLSTAALTPGSTGQAPAAALTLVAGGMKAAEAWTINIRVWTLDLIFLTWSLPLSILLLGRSTTLLGSSTPEIVAAVWFVGSVLLVAVLLLRLNWLTRTVSWVMRLPGLRRWRLKLDDFLGRIDQANRSLRHARWRLTGALNLLTFSVYFTTYFTFFVVVAAVRPNAPFLVTMASAQVPSVAASFFPTPGGTGLLEVGTASLMRLSTKESAKKTAPLAAQVPDVPAEGFQRAPGTAGVLVPTDDEAKARAPVAAAILAWRILTYYLRMFVGPLLGGSLIRRRANG